MLYPWSLLVEKGPDKIRMPPRRNNRRPAPVKMQERQLFTPQQKTNYRLVVLALITGYFLQKTFRKQLMPFGPAGEIPRNQRIKYANIDWANDSLQTKHGKTQRIFERLDGDEKPLMKGPETVVFGKDGTLYLLTEEGNLISLSDFKKEEDGVTIMAKSTLIKHLGIGRPLGGKFSSDGKTLYIADAILGLTRIHNPNDRKSKLELVASSAMEDGTETPIRYANDVAIGPKTGKVYFTDATDIQPDRSNDSWDTLYASKVDLLRGVARGRLLEYNPSTDETKVLARGIRFANGVAVDKDETFVIFAETFGLRILKYHLQGKEKGQLDIVIENKQMTGYPDGVDCSWKTGKCYSVIASPVVPLHKLMTRLSNAFDVALRTLLMSMPKSLTPAPKKYGGVIEFDPSGNGEVRYIQDPKGEDIKMLTGVTEVNGKLYLGSLENNYIGVYTLN